MTVLESNKKIRNRNKIPYIVITVLLIVAIAATLIIVLGDRYKNVKDLYFKIETKNFVNFMGDIIKKQNNTISKTKPLKEYPSRTRYEISLKLPDFNSQNIQGLQDTQTLNISKQTIDIINSSKIVLNSRYDIKNNEEMNSLSFLLEGQNFLDINTFSQKEMVGLQVPIIYDKYFAFDRNNISQALGRFDLDFPIKRFLFPRDIIKNLGFSPEDFSELKGVITEYISFMNDTITETNISLDRNIKLEQVEYTKTPGTQGDAKPKFEKCDIFTIKFTEKEFKSIVNKSISTLFSSTKLSDITLGKVFRALEMIESTGVLEFSRELETFYNQMKRYEDKDILTQYILDKFEGLHFPEGFNMTLIVDKSGNIVDRKISIENRPENEPKRKFYFHTGSFFTKLSIEQESDMNADGDTKGNFTRSSNSDSSTELGDNENALIELEIVKEKETENKLFYLNCINNIWPDFEAEINILKTSDEDNKRKTLNTNYALDINLSCRELGIEKGNSIIEIKKEDRYGIDFQMPEISKETVIIMESITENEIEEIITEIQFSALKFLLSNQYLINAFTSDK